MMNACVRHVGTFTLAGAVALGLGFGGTTTAFGQDTITFGASVSLTGNYSTNGEHTKNGYDLAVQRINSMGGVEVGGKTYNIEVKYYDDESTPARGAQLMERLINQDGVEFVLGPYSSGLTKAIAPVTEKYKIPMVEANGASNSLFTEGYEYLFAVLNTAEQYLSPVPGLVAEQMKANGRDPSSAKLALAFENDPFSQDVRTGVVNAAKEYGMEIVVDDKLPPDLNDMSATLNKVRALKPDVLIVSGHSKGATLGVRQTNDMQVSVPMLAMTHCDSAQVEKLGEPANYTVCASQWDRTLSYEDDVFGTAEQFAQDFEAEYGYAPPYQAAESAAGVMVYVDALRRAGTLDREAVRDALAETDMMTFYGPVKFNDRGMNVAKQMVMYQIQDGQYKVVAPTKWASSKLIYPAPNGGM